MGGKLTRHRVSFKAKGKKISFLAVGGKQTALGATRGDNVMASMPSRKR